MCQQKLGGRTHSGNAKPASRGGGGGGVSVVPAACLPGRVRDRPSGPATPVGACKRGAEQRARLEEVAVWAEDCDGAVIARRHPAALLLIEVLLPERGGAQQEAPRDDDHDRGKQKGVQEACSGWDEADECKRTTGGREPGMCGAGDSAAQACAQHEARSPATCIAHCAFCLHKQRSVVLFAGPARQAGVRKQPERAPPPLFLRQAGTGCCRHAASAHISSNTRSGRPTGCAVAVSGSAAHRRCRRRCRRPSPSQFCCLPALQASCGDGAATTPGAVRGNTCAAAGGAGGDAGLGVGPPGRPVAEPAPRPWRRCRRQRHLAAVQLAPAAADARVSGAYG